ncbi:uncharacterized protein LOC128726097 [Anopheles nili]|uniref:uncharacterized protein LOC128726097 n=1 Tax=Anopheles nili TaxID=185578 RepID=UPI00237B0150|nr:uncharacterized protein LOC128726097 [Anopheles nili]
MCDCFYLRPGSYQPLCGNVPSEGFPNHQHPPVEGSLVVAFLQHLHVHRVQYATVLRWYAVLISAIETVLLLRALVFRAGWERRLKWRPLWYVPEYLRINFALVTSLLTVYAGVMAMVGLLTSKPRLLLPYIGLHLATLTLELNYLTARTLAALPFGISVADSSVCPQTGPSKWQSLAMVMLLGFHLSIVIVAYLNHSLHLT